MRGLIRRAAPLFIVLVSLTYRVAFQTAYSQTVSGTIVGTVTDASGALVPGARITVTNENTNAHTKSTSNEAGIYRVPFLPPGTYSVRVEWTGFRTFLRQGLILRVDDILRVDE